MSELIITLEGGKQLLNPKMRILSITDYDVVTNIYNVNVLFRENGGLYDHLRTYQFENENLGGLQMTDAVTAIKSHPVIGVVPLILPDGTEI